MAPYACAITNQPEDASLAGSMPRQNLTEDVTQSVIAEAMGLIPLLGGTLSRAFENAANLAAARERDKWMFQQAETVDELASERGVTVNDLLEDGLFYEAVVRTSRSAQATSRDKKKRRMLAEAARNSGSWSTFGANSQRYLVRLADRSEPEHVRMISIIAEPSQGAWPDQITAGGPPEQDIMQLRLFEGDDDRYGVAILVLRDLFQESLTTEHLGLGYDTTPSMLNPQDHQVPVSSLGREFLGFLGEQ